MQRFTKSCLLGSYCSETKAGKNGNVLDDILTKLNRNLSSSYHKILLLWIMQASMGYYSSKKASTQQSHTTCYISSTCAYR